MISIYHPSYIQQNWHQSLVMIAIGVLGTFMNTYGAQHLPLLEGIVLVFHIFGFFCIIIPLWVLAPKAPASEVFGGFNDFGGWGSIGAACFVGTVAAAGSFGGSDAACHISEETRDASRSVRESYPLSVLLIPCENVQSYHRPAAAALVLSLASSSISHTSYAHLIASPGTNIDRYRGMIS
jgi:choline transport protein